MKPGEIPPVMQQLLGKDFTVTIELNEDNVKFGSCVFEACDLAIGFQNGENNKHSSESSDKSSENPLNHSSTILESESEENVKECVSLIN